MKSSVNLFLFGVILCTSCVPNKKYVYLQHHDVNRSVVSDSVLRRHKSPDFDYRIQPEDILSIKIQTLSPKEYDFFLQDAAASGQSVTQQANPLLIGELVDAEGHVPFPVIGKVKVSGMTVYQAQDTLQKLADQYLQSPIVKVRLINFRITVLGEVNREGTVVLTNNRVSMLEAIGLSGGLTDLADRSHIKLLRKKGESTEVQYLNLLDESFAESPFYYVNQNDILIVPALKQRPFRKYFGQNVSLLVSAITLIVLTVNLTQN